MASVQTTIKFPAKKSISSVSKKGKENLRSYNKSCKETAKDNKSDKQNERSPLKVSCEGNNCTTPSKRKSSEGDGNSSPSKLSKNKESPSQLISKVSLVTPEHKKRPARIGSPVKVTLFPEDRSESGARQALHRGQVATLPGREDKIDQITSVLLDGLKDRKSRSIYISGQPGTGKTACINYVSELSQIESGYKTVYINCTGLKTPSAIFCAIANKLGLKVGSRKSEKLYQAAIVKHFNSSKKMHLLVMDEQDELVCKGQQVLYSLLEWVSVVPEGLILVGIANCLNLIDRALPRLANASFKPILIHFSPYTSKQILEIIMDRLNQVDGSNELFAEGALHLLASKVAAVSGDVRRALDISSRILQESDGQINIPSVLASFNSVFSTAQTLTQSEDGFPLQQKIVVCSLMLLQSKTNKTDTTVGKLHDIYRKICEKKNMMSLDMTEFLSLIQLLETRGIIKLQGKSLKRMTKVVLQWDENEVTSALKDKELLSSIINNPSFV